MAQSSSSVADHRRVAACLAFFAASVIFSGCGEGKPKPDASTLATISGSVMNDGKPVTPESSVVFYCPEKSATAAGKIDTLGKFSLTAADANIGIPAGRYQVMIRPPEAPPVTVGTEQYEKMMSAGRPGNATVPPKPAERSPDIPSKFHAFDTSGIALEVKAGANTFDLDLAKLGG